MWNRPENPEWTSGDDGLTYLDTGERVPKTHTRIVAAGDLEELICHIGLVMHCTIDPDLIKVLNSVQHTLDNIRSEFLKPYRVILAEGDLDVIEDALIIAGYIKHDAYHVLPDGSKEMIQVMLAGTVCRRAERNMWKANNFSSDGDPYNEWSFKYINRLGDLLFALTA